MEKLEAMIEAKAQNQYIPKSEPEPLQVVEDEFQPPKATATKILDPDQIRTNSMSNFSAGMINTNRKMVYSKVGGSDKTCDDADKRSLEEQPGREQESSYCAVPVINPLNSPFVGKLELKNQSSTLGL